MNQYSGTTPGLFPDPYGWWSGGIVWDAMVDYSFLTRDASYNDVVANALQSQVGENNNYQPVTQTADEVGTSTLWCFPISSVNPAHLKPSTLSLL